MSDAAVYALEVPPRLCKDGPEERTCKGETFHASKDSTERKAGGSERAARRPRGRTAPSTSGSGGRPVDTLRPGAVVHYRALRVDVRRLHVLGRYPAVRADCQCSSARNACRGVDVPVLRAASVEAFRGGAEPKGDALHPVAGSANPHTCRAWQDATATQVVRVSRAFASAGELSQSALLEEAIGICKDVLEILGATFRQVRSAWNAD